MNDREIFRKEKQAMREAADAGMQEFIKDYAEVFERIPNDVFFVVWMHGFACGGDFEADRDEAYKKGMV
jgi:hypothetical protein